MVVGWFLNRFRQVFECFSDRFWTVLEGLG